MNYKDFRSLIDNKDLYQDCRRPFKIETSPASDFAKDPTLYLTCLCGHGLKDHNGAKTCNQRAWYKEAQCDCRVFKEMLWKDFQAKGEEKDDWKDFDSRKAS